jgi:hypothetical protein
MSKHFTRKWTTLLAISLAIGLLAETTLHAASTTRTDSMAAATGPVDDDTEGLFTLDFQTGDLLCFVMYPKGAGARKLGGFFKTNVLKDLGVDREKKPNYMLITGQTNFLRGSGTVRPGFSVFFVFDVNTGKFAAYGVPWDATSAARSAPQRAALILLDAQTIRRKN